MLEHQRLHGAHGQRHHVLAVLAEGQRFLHQQRAIDSWGGGCKGSANTDSCEQVGVPRELASCDSCSGSCSAKQPVCGCHRMHAASAPRSTLQGS